MKSKAQEILILRTNFESRQREDAQIIDEQSIKIQELNNQFNEGDNDQSEDLRMAQMEITHLQDQNDLLT